MELEKLGGPQKDTTLYSLFPNVELDWERRNDTFSTFLSEVVMTLFGSDHRDNNKTEHFRDSRTGRGQGGRVTFPVVNG